jgi:protein-disulfide isomerase
MRLSLFLACIAATGLALSGCDKAAKGESDTAKTVPVDAAFGEKVRSYLIQNPEVLVEVSQALQAKQAAEELKAAEDGRKRIPKFRMQLEKDKRDFVANPDGKITVVQFYDYNCGYCKLIAPEVMDLIRKNPDVRFVFKDYTLGNFGPTSEYAAAAARALNEKGLFLDSHAEMMARKPLTDAMVDDLLRRNGIDPGTVRELEASPAQQQYIQDTRKLAGNLGLNGTPAFVIGDTVVPGADPTALRAAIQAAKANR